MRASTGRADYDQTVSLTTLEPGEPIFVIRGRDAVGAGAVRAWANLAAKAGAPIEAVELALQQADRLEAWPDKKKPDGPDLTEGQRKQLRYEHSRRAWDGRAVVETEAGLLAAQLARSQIVAAMRPGLDRLASYIDLDMHVPEEFVALFEAAGRDLHAELNALDTEDIAD